LQLNRLESDVDLSNAEGVEIEEEIETGLSHSRWTQSVLRVQQDYLSHFGCSLAVKPARK